MKPFELVILIVIVVFTAILIVAEVLEFLVNMGIMHGHKDLTWWYAGCNKCNKRRGNHIYVLSGRRGEFRLNRKGIDVIHSKQRYAEQAYRMRNLCNWEHTLLLF